MRDVCGCVFGRRVGGEEGGGRRRTTSGDFRTGLNVGFPNLLQFVVRGPLPRTCFIHNFDHYISGLLHLGVLIITNELIVVDGSCRERGALV